MITGLLLAHLIPVFLTAQSGGCPNLGFEQGDFSHWEGGIGFCCPINVGGSIIIPERQTIMSGSGTDPYTDDAISVVAPGGGSYSVRLGNPLTGAEAERLSYVMQVDASNALFVYRYAVVLEDPFHDPEEQPRFEIRITKVSVAQSVVSPKA